MKIVSLNTWGGILTEKILNFLLSNKEIVDIFCFQEIYNGGKDDEDEIGSIYPTNYELLLNIKEALPDFNFYFAPYHKDYYGLSIFIRNTIPVQESGSEVVYQQEGVGSNFEKRILQFVTIKIGDSLCTILNFHGISSELGRNDSSVRLSQSFNIIKFLKQLTPPYILCGDFNLSLNTQSIETLEEGGLHNLIRVNNITSTRTSYYKKDDKHADYIFLSDGFNVKEFKVLTDEVSDHSPLFVDLTLV